VRQSSTLPVGERGGNEPLYPERTTDGFLHRSSVFGHQSFQIIACLKLIERRKYLRSDDQLMVQADELTNLEFAKLSAFIKRLRADD